MACSPGEEAALESAANLLDQEAKKLSAKTAYMKVASKSFLVN